MKVAIIGGGACGVLAAVRLKEIDSKNEVVIFERENKILNKVFRSGNGRANFGNTDISEYYYTNQAIILKMQEYLEKNNLEDSNQFIEGRGLLSYSDSEGRMYPLANDAKSLVSLLEYLLFLNHVEIKTGVKASVKPAGGKYEVAGQLFDYVILATGSNASLKYKEEEQYSILDSLSLEKDNIEPGLVGFKLYNDLDGLFGLRLKARLTLDNLESYGEVIFKEDGVSGICLMNLANYYHENADIYADFIPDFEDAEIWNLIQNKLKKDPNIKLYNLLIGALPNKLLAYINKKYDNQFVYKMKKEELKEYLCEFRHFKFSIKEKYDYQNAQIILGGIKEDCLDFFETKKYKGVYVGGELYPNAGVCGGYNLWFAFTSGLIIANMISEDSKNES